MSDRTPARGRVTIAEVARAAGVSPTTVSFVVNDKRGVSIAPATRERVKRAVEELGYKPNALARNLGGGRSSFIGLVSDAIATTPFAGQLVQGAQEEAWRRGHVLLVANTGGDASIESEALAMMAEHRVAGVLYSSWFHHQVTPPPALRELRHVLVNCFSEDPQTTAVVPDEVQGGRTATQILLDAGHRRIAFLNATDDSPAVVGRLEGYRAALGDAGISVERDLVLPVGHDQESGYRAARLLLDMPRPPSAVFCYNDRVAMGLYDALREHGLTVPQDMAVVGFDNQEVIAAHLRPPLTSVALPHHTMGVEGVRALLGTANTVAPGRLLVSCPAVNRQSVAQPRRAALVARR